MTANCFLANKDYTIYNALSWGYCKEHYLRASVEGPWVQRLGHGMIATLEFIPVISQIASLFEMAIASLCEPRADTPIDLSAREVRPIDPIELPLSPRNQLSSRFDISQVDPSVELKGFKKYKALLNENTIDQERALILPTRRVCGFGCMDSFHAHGLAGKAIFITQKEIVKIHPMRFLRKSPFVRDISPGEKRFYAGRYDNDPIWESVFDTMNKQLYAIGLIESGKHVILQQAVRSCVPTCVAMLVLDRGKTPNYKAIETTSLANADDAVRWVRDAGLNPQKTEIQDLKNAAEILHGLIQTDGPGVLSIGHPVVGGHVIILDQISIEENTAMIRDSFHGWALTIKLDALLSWLENDTYFVQIQAK